MSRKFITAAISALLLTGCAAGSSVSAATAVSETPATGTITEDESRIPLTLTIRDDHPDMSGYRWLDDPNPAFAEISIEESTHLFEKGQDGILLYSFETCPWCNRAIPVLNEAAKEEGIKVYYVNVYADYYDNEEKIVPGSEEAYAIYDKVIDCIKTELDTDENGDPSFEVPLVIAVKDGSIVGSHTSLVDGFEITDENTQLNEEQHNELLHIYENLIASVLKGKEE